MASFPDGVESTANITFVSHKWEMPKAQVNQSQLQLSGGGFNACLYIPAGIRDAISANWGSEVVPEEMYNSSALAGTGARAVRKGLEMGKQQAGAFATGAAATTGTAKAPNELLLFQGMNYLDFSASFEMIPKNKGEANAIMAIINGFKESIKPALEQDSKMMKLDYPPVFDIICRTPGKTLFKYKNMALVSVDVTYAGGANSMLYYYDGNPVQATLSVSFKSIEQAFKR